MNDYFVYYILSYFNGEHETNASQIFHVLQGKRTPTMFYMVEKNKWHHGFSNFSKISREKLDQIIQQFLQLNWLEKKNKGYILTEQGHQTLETYFNSHHFPCQIKSFSNIKLRKPFWDRYQLFTQIFSERSFNNNNYIPIIKHPVHQEQIRLFFRYFKNQPNQLLEKWIEEQYSLFSFIEEERVNQLFKHLSGHSMVGDTKSQVREKLAMEKLEYEFYHLDTIEMTIECIKKHKEEMPLMYAILQSLLQETGYGLSASTYQTYLSIQKGKTIREISLERRLKENTVREHILEIAFVFDEFPYDEFLSPTLKQALNEKFKQDESYSFKKAVSDFPSIEFMEYRLIELERMRRE